MLLTTHLVKRKAVDGLPRLEAEQRRMGGSKTSERI